MPAPNPSPICTSCGRKLPNLEQACTCGSTATADARLKMRDDMSRAIEATNCMMVKVAGTAHFVRTNKIEARNLCRLTGGAIPYRAEAGFLYIG